MNRIALRLGLACVALLGFAACGDPEPIITVPDSSVADSGGGGGTDSGMTGEPDAGPTDDCPSATAPAPTAAVCEMATLTCLMGAASPAAQQACIEADAMPMPCNSCIIQDVYASCTRAGCDDEFGEVQCCLEDACPTGEAACLNAAGAAGGACATETMAFGSCLDTAQMARSCGVSTVCFGAATTTFGPDFSPRGFVPFSLPAN